MNGLPVWIGFNAALVALLSLDLLVLHRSAHAVRAREALAQSAFWIGLAMAFAGGLWWFEGRAHALQFVTGYVIEESLSVDNLFVMMLLFAHFGVPEQYQHRVLFWGILGAMVMRLGLIVAGVALIQRLHFIVYVFGAIVLFSGIQMLRRPKPEVDPKHNLGLRLLQRVMPVDHDLTGGRFLTRREGRWHATPLLAALVVIEFADLTFAVDSVPAVLAVSRDPFIVYSSNALAILGLRSLYFALARLMKMFRYLNVGLGLILGFVGIKMLISGWIEIPVPATLAVVVGIIALATAASLLAAKRAR